MVNNFQLHQYQQSEQPPLSSQIIEKKTDHESHEDKNKNVAALNRLMYIPPAL